jgi:hypothetical protein
MQGNQDRNYCNENHQLDQTGAEEFHGAPVWHRRVPLTCLLDTSSIRMSRSTIYAQNGKACGREQSNRAESLEDHFDAC